MPVTAPPPLPNGTSTVKGSRPFGQQNEIFASPLNNGGKPAEENGSNQSGSNHSGSNHSGSNHSGMDETDHLDFAVEEHGRAGDDHIQLLTQLCELNVALFQHPLHRENDKAGVRTMMASHLEKPTEQQPVDAPPGDSSSNHSSGSSIADLNVSDLRTGNLFEMTCRLKDIVTRIRAQDEAAAQGPERYDRSTALMALSCYTRLDVLYSRALDIMIRIRNNGSISESSRHLMPELVIDGFSMGRCVDLQLNFLIQIHEQARERIRSCIRSAEGTALVGRDRRDPVRQKGPVPLGSTGAETAGVHYSVR